MSHVNNGNFSENKFDLLFWHTTENNLENQNEFGLEKLCISFKPQYHKLSVFYLYQNATSLKSTCRGSIFIAILLN